MDRCKISFWRGTCITFNILRWSQIEVSFLQLFMCMHLSSPPMTNSLCEFCVSGSHGIQIQSISGEIDVGKNRMHIFDLNTQFSRVNAITWSRAQTILNIHPNIQRQRHTQASSRQHSGSHTISLPQHTHETNPPHPFHQPSHQINRTIIPPRKRNPHAQTNKARTRQ